MHEQLLIQHFYEGLMFMDKQMIDAASGGGLADKTLATTRLLIQNMTSNNQQFGTKRTQLPYLEESMKSISLMFLITLN